jgi:hypothetical protein
MSGSFFRAEAALLLGVAGLMGGRLASQGGFADHAGEALGRMLVLALLYFISIWLRSCA